MQPYQEASEEVKRQKNLPGKVLKNIGTGAAFASGGAAISRIAPLLSRFIPAEMAVKGLSKINPTIGKFISGAVNKGNTINDALDFLRNKLGVEEEPQQEEQQQAQQTEQKNPLNPGGFPKKKQGLDMISSYSPELAQFLTDRIKQGKNPEEAAMTAKVMHGQITDEIEKDTGENFIDLVLRLLGSTSVTQGKPQIPQQQSQRPQMQTNDQTNRSGQGQAALMAILQKMQQSRGVK